MKSNKPYVLGCLVFPLILIIVFAISFFGSFNKLGKSSNIPSNAWLSLDLSGIVSDYNEYSMPQFLESQSESARDVIDKVIHAASDKRIKGILIEPGFMQINQANLAEIGKAIEVFKKSQKPVVAYSSMMSQADYLLCAMADSLWMEASASGGIILEGVSANVLFYKEALQKLGIKMHVMQAGEFKGAGEPYTRTDLSPGAKENMDKVLLSRYQLLINQIAKNRNLPFDKVKDILENREELFISGKAAMDYGLVDNTASYDDFLQHFGINQESILSLKKYQPIIRSAKKENVAIINLSGTINSSDEYAQNSISLAKLKRSINELEKDSSIKAVVIRINSPGGSALESELIYQKLKALKSKYPLVISMGATAASGGYYISCAADHIIADPACVTGSIGVIMAVPETKELGNKLGLHSQTLRHGKFAGAINLFETYEPSVLQALKLSSEAVYTEFKQRVSEARKIPMQSMPQVAEGRVFSPEDALKLKLIDAIGSQEDAVKKAASLANIKDYGIVYYPAKVSFFELLRKSGFANYMSMLTSAHMEPKQMIERHVLQRFNTNVWLYQCPWNL